MNPTSPQINQNQQSRLNAVMNTPTAPAQNTQPAQTQSQVSSPPAPGTVGSIAPAGVPGLGSAIQPQQPQQSSYQVPTVGLPTSPDLGGAMQPGATAQHAKKDKSKHKQSGGFSLLPILFIIGGIIFLAVYTIVWSVVFGVSIPFLPF